MTGAAHPPLVERLLQRWAKLQRDRGHIEQDIRDIGAYILPEAWDLRGEERPGAPVERRLADTTGSRACEELATFISARLCPPDQPWLTLRLQGAEGDPMLAPDDQVLQAAQWAQTAVRWVFDDLASGFYDALGAALRHFCAGLPAIIWVDRRSGGGGVRFEALSVGQTWIARGNTGQIDTLFRSQTMSAWEVQEQYPASARAARLCAENRGDDLLRLLQVCLPERDVPDGSAAQRGWALITIDRDDRQVIERGHRPVCPFAVASYAPVVGDVYGTGPGRKALGEILALQQMRIDTLRVSQHRHNPAMLGNIELKRAGVLQSLRPGSVIWVPGHLMQSGKTLEPIRRGEDLRTGGNELEQMRAEVRAHFHTDRIRPPQGDQVSYMKAANVLWHRWDGGMVVLPPMLRFERSALAPLVLAVFGLLHHEGQLVDVDGRAVHVGLENPLTRAADLGDLMNVSQLVEVAGKLAAFDPMVPQMLDGARALRQAARNLRTDVALIRTDEEIVQLQQRADQQNQMQQQMAAMQAGSQAFANVAKGAAALSPPAGPSQ